MKKLISLTEHTELSRLMAECTVNNVRFQKGPTSYSCQDCFSGVIHLTSLKQLANQINGQLKELDSDDLFADLTKAKTNDKELLTLKRDTLVAIVKFIDAQLKADALAEKTRTDKLEKARVIKGLIATKEFEKLAATDSAILRKELEELEAE